jgi:hypothetical protein
MEEENIDDDHVENPSDLARAMREKMESRIKDEGLPRNHAVPPWLAYSNGYIVILADLEVLEK